MAKSLCSKCGLKRGEGTLVCEVEDRHQQAQGKYFSNITQK